ncbi:MAG: cell envelope integrity protein CreD [Erythrobacter sp.]
MKRERSPGLKLLFAALVGAALIIPLIMVYALVSDRQHQARIAQNSIVAGWAGAQVIAGPVMVIPYTAERISNEEIDGRTVTRRVETREMLFISADTQRFDTVINPDIKTRGKIYQSVIYDIGMEGLARFKMPADLDRYGVTQEQLLLDEAEIRFPISDPRGLQTDAQLIVDGAPIELRPGMGTGSSDSGIHAFFDWSSAEDVELEFSYTLRGSSTVSMAPSGNETNWNVRSDWPHPSFSGGFLPTEDTVEIADAGFEASWSISNLALGQSLVSKGMRQLPIDDQSGGYSDYVGESSATESPMATIRLVEPVDLYSRVDRSVKYGFLFIGFTFLAFLMFDIVGGARVSAAEYLLSGVGLVLFFVMLLAFSELVGFAIAYLIASAAIIGLITAYSAAVLGSWRRAVVIGGMLIGLYALLYVLLNLEAWSLMIGSILLFVALAGVMYATRQIDWSNVNNSDDEEPEPPVEEAART